VVIRHIWSIEVIVVWDKNSSALLIFNMKNIFVLIFEKELFFPKNYPNFILIFTIHGKKILFISICCTFHLSDLTMKDGGVLWYQKDIHIHYIQNKYIFQQTNYPAQYSTHHACIWNSSYFFFQLSDTCQLLHNLLKNSDKWKIILVSFYATVCKQRLCSLSPYTAVFKHVPLCKIKIISF
jgi:hypothetical protein